MFLIKYIFNLPRPIKRVITLLIDTLFVSIAYWSAFIVRLDSYKVLGNQEYWTLLAVVLPITLLVFIRLGLYRAVLRYMGPKAAVTILAGISVSVLTLVLAVFFTGYFIPRTVPFIFAAFLLILTGGSRFIVRTLAMNSNSSNHERVVIYGAGNSGRQLATALMQGNEYEPVAFIDDDKALEGSFIHGRPVYSFDHLPQLIVDASVKRVLLALSSISKSDRSRIIAQLEPLAVEVMSIPRATDLVSGEAKIDELRDVAIEDLLGREQVEPDQRLMEKNIINKVVMVTGAGGSIGSELCRQIVEQQPKVLVLFELSEYALYNIESEVRKILLSKNLSTVIHPIMGNVQDKKTVCNVMKNCGVQTVYHAAAYKHVPLVEYNVIEGVRNNIFGTYNTADAAIEAGVETFILISTDKAVRPTNIMGATKRVAELCLQGLAKKQSNTLFTMVRFGNVLGSSGSVVPLFRQQIRKGGPVTVTHKDIIRYFMTIPEASQLVIQAGAMSKGGDVFVLDMGEPVKISDLAIKMIHLMGLEVKDSQNPNGDIEIAYSGLRPGEKLYEELLIGESAYATEHARIMTSNELSLPWEEVAKFLSDLELACDKFDVTLIYHLLKTNPIHYKPNSESCDIVSLQDNTKKNENVIFIKSNIDTH